VNASFGQAAAPNKIASMSDTTQRLYFLIILGRGKAPQATRLQKSLGDISSISAAALSPKAMRTIDRRVRKYQERKQALTGLGHLKP
jgi:hypothetical protein